MRLIFLKPLSWCKGKEKEEPKPCKGKEKKIETKTKGKEGNRNHKPKKRKETEILLSPRLRFQALEVSHMINIWSLSWNLIIKPKVFQ